jgi:hypothetical protein
MWRISSSTSCIPSGAILAMAASAGLGITRLRL